MAGDTPRSQPTPFLTKTYQLVDDTAVDDVISWNEDGSSFVVWNTAEFARDLLPKYFKHNFSSFVRQLNTYGFRKVMPDRWEFSHDFFRRGEKRLLCEIQRRKIGTPTALVAAKLFPTVGVSWTVSPSVSGEEQVISADSSAREFSGGSMAELIGENERLRKRNLQLNKELSQMKSLCNDIYVLMSNYWGRDGKDTGDSSKSSSAGNVVKPLDLLPMTRYRDDMEVDGEENGGRLSSIRSAAEEIRATLFGMPIGVKRGRISEGRLAYEMDLQLQQPGVDIKPETSDNDQGSSCDLQLQQPGVDIKPETSGNDQGSSCLTRCNSTRNTGVL